MDSLDQFDLIDAQVRRIFRIDDITAGTMQQGYIRRYRGQLDAANSAQAYDQLAESLRPYHFTPLFRKEGPIHLILLIVAVVCKLSVTCNIKASCLIRIIRHTQIPHFVCLVQRNVISYF